MKTRLEADARTGDTPSLSNSLRAGALWGLLAAVVMAMYAMVAAATYQRTGFFTPLYHIASTFIDPNPMMASMEKAAENRLFHFQLGPALVGMVVHLIVGAAYGVIFGLIARALRLRGSAAVGAGAVYGILAMAFSSVVVLPVAASLFGGGDPISAMPSMVGWATFTVEHLIFGTIVGIGYSLAIRSEAFESGPVARGA